MLSTTPNCHILDARPINLTRRSNFLVFMAFSYYQNAAPTLWGTSQYQLGPPPTPTFRPNAAWSGLDYYRAYSLNPDISLYSSIWNRIRASPLDPTFSSGPIRSLHRQIYSGWVDLFSVLPSDLGAAAAYEAYRTWKYHTLLYQPLGGDPEREREALVGFAVAEASRLWQHTGRVMDAYGQRDALESAAQTASYLYFQKLQSRMTLPGLGMPLPAATSIPFRNPTTVYARDYAYRATPSFPRPSSVPAVIRTSSRIGTPSPRIMSSPAYSTSYSTSPSDTGSHHHHHHHHRSHSHPRTPTVNVINPPQTRLPGARYIGGIPPIPTTYNLGYYPGPSQVGRYGNTLTVPGQTYGFPTLGVVNSGNVPLPSAYSGYGGAAMAYPGMAGGGSYGGYAAGYAAQAPSVTILDKPHSCFVNIRSLVTHSRTPPPNLAFLCSGGSTKSYLHLAKNYLLAKMNRIHNIALQCIFDALIVPSGFLITQSSNFHVRGWLEDLRIRKSLALVCKQWYYVALPYLYSKIHLRRIGQLPALVNTLRGNPTNFNELITTISFEFLVPDNCRHFTQSCVAFIIENCSFLSSLSFTNPCGGFNFISYPSSEGYAPPYVHWITSSDSVKSTMKNNAKRITSLELLSHYNFLEDSDDDRSPSVITFISWFKNLSTLSLTLSHSSLRPREDCRKTVLELKALMDLTLTIEVLRSPGNNDLHTCLLDVCEWTMPKLSSMTLSTRFDHGGFGETSLINKQIVKFLNIHGSKLSYLDISSLYHAKSLPKNVNERLSPYSTVLSTVLRDRCSSLRHVVLSEYTNTYDPSIILDILLAPGRRIQCHIDVWDHPYSCSRPLYDGQPYLSFQPNSSFLRPHVRVFDSTALSHLRNLPRLLSPFTEQVRPSYIHDIHNLRIIENSSCVFEKRGPEDCNMHDDDDLGPEPDWYSSEGSDCSSCYGDDLDDCYYFQDAGLDIESDIEANPGDIPPPFHGWSHPLYALEYKQHTAVPGQLTEEDGLLAFRLGLALEKQRDSEDNRGC
ncbi:hypothetical protein ABKN59_010613 [Abortiporus biennis]